jgi:glycosyltransferase involved in cell wall biosynthesis
MNTILDFYLNKQNPNKALINEPPKKHLQLIVIIPAYNEPDILTTLNSLKRCTPAKYPSEVIVLINHSSKAPNSIVHQNHNTYHQVLEWIKTDSTPHLKFHCVIKGDFPEKHAGVGLARKTLMDEACRRFATNNNEAGIIASCDADSLVSINYIADIQKTFIADKKLNCTPFFFEHQITDYLSDLNKNAIRLYEMYLRYFKLALKSTGFPYAFHTVGSSFAVRASAYAKQGGMSKRQAGEDFYFLHKIFPLGNCMELNNVIVYPSARPSDRVPFGTGNAVQKILIENEFLTYHPIYFKHLNTFFTNAITLFNKNNEAVNTLYKKLDSTLQCFLSKEEFIQSISELKGNCATEKTYIHRFYQWFDAFKIIKYLNFVHNTVPRIPITDAVHVFFDMQKKAICAIEPNDLLTILKEMELN